VQKTEYRVTEVGWRYWWLRTEDGMLFSPHGIPAAGAPFGKRSLVAWPGPRYRPVCPEDQDHVPPVPSCLCGVYFAPHLLDVLGMAQQLRLGVEATQKPSADFLLAVGRLTFTDPVVFGQDHVDPLMAEGRAAAATIKRLWVLDDWIPDDLHLRLRVTTSLKNRYRVPVVIGRPECAPGDYSHPSAPRIELDRLQAARQA
jgi:hypothetical protein